MIPQRVTLITLGVADVAASRRFYEDLGFRPAEFDSEEVAFFDMTNGVALAVFGREALAEDANVPANTANSPAGISLAINLDSEVAVDQALAEVASKGARITQPPRKVFWGGYSGYFADPDGYLWEIAYNPLWSVDDRGRMQLPPPKSP